MKFWTKIRALVRRRKLDAEMSEEMRLHLELQTERNVAAGMSADEARYAARRMFGGVEQIKERCRDQRGWVWIEQMGQDARYAGRQLRRSPVFAVVAIFMLALGIGTCTAIFTVVNAVMLRPITIPESERLVVIQETHPRYPLVAVSPANFRVWHEHADVFESMAVRSGYNSTLTGQGEPVRVNVAGVTGRYFEMLRLQPAIGRVFGEAEQSPDKSNVVVLTHAFWLRQFGGSAEVVGSDLQLGSQLVTVLGIMPADFRSEDADLLMPIGIPEEMWQTRGRFFRGCSHASNRG